MKEPTEELKRVVGVFGLSTNFINIMVGAGIFALPAIVAAGLGAASIYAYIFCGVLVALVMLCFAEAGSRLTATGGAYLYIKTAFGPYFGFITSILFILASISADAAVANAIVNIFGSIFPVFKILAVKIATIFCFFFVFAYVNVRGVKTGMAVVKFFTITKLIPLLLIVSLSWGYVSFDNLAITTNPTFAEIAKISLILFFAFQGAETGLSISGEVKNPRKTIPKSIFISILVVLVLYILIQTVSQGVLGAELPSFKDNPLGAVADKVFGSIGFKIMTIGAAVSMIGYMCSAILSMPRILYRASIDNVLPVKALRKVHPRFQTPFIAIITYAFCGFLFASIGGFEQLAVISSATILLIYLGVALAVIKLKRTAEPSEKGFVVPGGLLIPVLASLTILYLLSNLARNEFVVILGSILLLTLIYLLKTRSTKGT